MHSRTSSKSLKTSLLFTATSLLLGLSLSACQSTMPSHHTAHLPASTQNTLEVLAVPVADTGLSVDADSSFAIVELMPLIVTEAEALELTPAQINVFADYRKMAMKNRMALQANEKALRGQLRVAMMTGTDDAAVTALMHRISETEMAHMKLRYDCIKNVRENLTAEQFDTLMQMYVQTLKR